MNKIVQLIMQRVADLRAQRLELVARAETAEDKEKILLELEIKLEEMDFILTLLRTIKTEINLGRLQR